MSSRPFSHDVTQLVFQFIWIDNEKGTQFKNSPSQTN